MAYLSNPTRSLEQEYKSFFNEWKQSGETMIPWVIQKDPTDFQEMLQFLSNNEQGIGIPEGWVCDSTYWLVDQSSKVLGAVNIRHELTEHLTTRGGHIGYGIRPSERRKGYATELLRLSLDKAKELGLDRVLVTCDESNVGSLKTIINNGGIPDADFIEPDGTVIKRFWIDLV